MDSHRVTIIVAWTALAVLAIGAAWDLTLPCIGMTQDYSFCSHLRHWNTLSNDLLASMMFALDGYLFCAWYFYTGRDFKTRDERILFLGWAYAGLNAHLWLLSILHYWGVQSHRP